LIARAAQARDVLPDALRERGAEVDVVALYETVAEPIPAPLLEAALAADYVTFTSSSTVGFFLSASGGEARFAPGARIVSIGPVTSEALRAAGLEPAVEAERHDVEGLIEALVLDSASRVEEDREEPRRGGKSDVDHRRPDAGIHQRRP
jgi:uroporphyrinogen III methyltransferase/synthase